MSLKVGPIGISASSDTVNEPENMSIDGDRITITGKFRGNSVAERTALRDQLRGLVEPGQPMVIPFSSSVDPSLDGFYRILGVTADIDPVHYLARGWSGWKVELERLPGGNALPAIESVLLGGFRTNTVGISAQANAANSHTAAVVEPLAWWSYPSLTIELASIAAGTHTTAYDTTRVTGWPGGYQTQTIGWAISAANYYSGGCEIEQLVGSRWMRVVGRQPVITDPTNLRISNGYMGVKFDDTSGNDYSGLQFFGFGRTAGVLDWTSKGTFMQWGFSAGLGDFSSKPVVKAISVLRNDPEEVRVRVTATGGTARGAFNLDITLRRGADHVTVVYVADEFGLYSKGGWQFDVASSAVPVTTVSTYGAYRTSTSGSIQPWVMCSRPITVDAANGILEPTTTLTSKQVSAWGLGPVFEAYADNGDNGSAMRWFAPFTERQRIVGR